MCAVRIPVYERSVQLDAAAQTMPRFTADTEKGKAIASIGSALGQVSTSVAHLAAHWQAKQDQFDKMQLSKATALLNERIRMVIQEETLKFDATQDRPGTLHDRVQARVAPMIAEFKSNGASAPGLAREYNVVGSAAYDHSSILAGTTEKSTANQQITNRINLMVGQVYKGLEENPDSWRTAPAEIRDIIKQHSALGHITPDQARKMERGYLEGVPQRFVNGFERQNRREEGMDASRQFAQERKRDELAAVEADRQKLAAVGKRGVDPNQYNTKLPPNEEAAFRAWKEQNAPKDSGQDYDWRGAFKGGAKPDAEGHWPDTWKKPNHPTFSTDSQYAKERPDLAGTWKDNQFVQPTIEPPKPQRIGPQSNLFREVTPDDGTARSVGLRVGERDENALNQKRIAEIDAKPEIKAAIEKVAQESGMDPNVLKVAASIESSGNPNQRSKSGEHHGLFQLTKAEMGMHGNNADINNPEANTRAYVAILQRNAPQLEKELGRPPNTLELYFSHQQGVGGAAAHLKNPDQPAWKTMMSTSEGQQKGEAWAKRAIEGNIPKDVLSRLFGGDVTKVSSGDMLAIQGTRFTGGSVDEAVTAARVGPREAPRVVVASADGTVTSDSRPPPSYVGGMNVGGPPQQSPMQSARVAFTEGQQFGRQATAGAEPFKGIIIHYTGTDSLKSALNTLQQGDPQRGGKSFGYHYYIDKDGTVIQGAPLEARTNHVQGWPHGGRSDRPDLNNNNTLGIAFVGTGKPTEQQLAAGYALTKEAQATINPNFVIPNENVAGHGQVQAGSRSPDEGIELVNAVRSGQAPAAPAGGTRIATAGDADSPLSRWDAIDRTMQTRLEGSGLKAAAIAKEFKIKLENHLKSDEGSYLRTGHGATLPPDLQKYYGTNKFTYEFISNKLGTDRALQWQENTEYAAKVFQKTDGMNQMSIEGMFDRLQAVKPAPDSPNYDKEKRVYDAVEKTATHLKTERDKDPSGYVQENMPDVKAAYDDVLKDPTNQDKIDKLISARMAAQNQLQVPDGKQTPITVNEARLYAAPLQDRARADTPEQVGREVAQAIIKRVGKSEDLAHRALTTVLKEQNIRDAQAKAAADALQAELRPKPEVQVGAGATPRKPGVVAPMRMDAYESYDISGVGGSYYGAKDDHLPGSGFSGLSTDESQRTGYMPMGTMDPELVKQLRANPNDDNLIQQFNARYGSGAASAVLTAPVGGATPNFTPQDVFTPGPDAGTETFNYTPPDETAKTDDTIITPYDSGTSTYENSGSPF